VQDDIHLLFEGGNLALCDQFDVDVSGTVRPVIVGLRDLRPSDILRGDRAGQFTIPGIDIRYYRHAPDGYVIWSLRFSLLIPIVVSLLLAVLLQRRLVRLRRHTEQGSEDDTDRGPQRLKLGT
jgi:hypothetical protein